MDPSEWGPRAPHSARGTVWSPASCCYIPVNAVFSIWCLRRVTKVDYAMASNILSQLSQLIDFSPKGCMVKRETPNCWSLCCGPLRAEVNSEKMRLCILVTKVPQQIELAIDIEETLQKKILRSL
eukprot:scaffold7205_cov523-Prasinococcus_capsulatus_cf.AAC.6